MSQLERYGSDLGGALRGLWDDVGWRTVLIASFLIFWLEVSMYWANPPKSGDSVLWVAMEVTLVLISRVLAGRTGGRWFAGDLRHPANMTVLLFIVYEPMVEVAGAFSGADAWLATQTIYWPYILLALFGLVLARLLAPLIIRPANVFVLLFAFLVFWLETADWLAGSSVPAAAGYVRWLTAVVALALISRGIVGRGFGGSVVNPLNLTTLFLVVGIMWVEIGMYFAGGGLGFALKPLAWPWQLLFVGTAVIARLGAHWASPYLTARVASPERDSD